MTLPTLIARGAYFIILQRKSNFIILRNNINVKRDKIQITDKDKNLQTTILENIIECVDCSYDKIRSNKFRVLRNYNVQTLNFYLQ